MQSICEQQLRLETGRVTSALSSWMNLTRDCIE